MSTRDLLQTGSRLAAVQLLNLIISFWTTVPLLRAQDIAAQQVIPSFGSSTSSFEHEKEACLKSVSQSDAVGAATHYRTLYRIAMQETDDKKRAKAAEEVEMCRTNLPPGAVQVSRPKDYSENSLVSELRRRLRPEELSIIVNPLAATPEMEKRAHELVAGSSNEVTKARMLYEALSQLPNQQSSNRARTASEVFIAWSNQEGHFSCWDLTCLYIALARTVGLKAYGTSVSEDFYGCHASHACAAVFLPHESLLVDPTYGIFGALHLKFTILDDLQMMAAYLCQQEELAPCKIASKLAPELPLVRFNLFVGFTTEGLWNEAEREVANLSHLDPDGPNTAWAEAKVALQKGRAEDACTLLAAALKKAPDSYKLTEFLGLIYTQLGRLQEAKQCYQNALRYSADTGLADSLRSSIDSINATGWFLSGWERLTNLDFDVAVTNFNKALQLNARLAPAFYGRGYVEQMKGQWSAALVDYEKTLELNPNYAEAYLGRGDAMQNKSNLEGALADYNKAIAINTNLAEAFHNRGLVKAHNGDMAGAVADFDKALLVKPNLTAGYENRAYAKKLTGDLDGALRDFNTALQLEPALAREIAPEFASLGWLHYCRKNFNAALTNAQRASELSKADDYYPLLIWLARSRLGQLASATQELNLYLKERIGENPGAWPTPVAQFLLGRFTEQDLLQAATNANPQVRLEQQCQACFYAGARRLVLNDSSGAKAYFERCLNTKASTRPEYSGARAELRWLSGKLPSD